MCKNKSNSFFYCYSQRLTRFCQAFGIFYIRQGINSNTNTKYSVFQKSKKLDDVIKLWNEVKKKFNDYDGGDQ